MDITDWLLAACMFLAATLYTSVGHAGASAYLALMALFGLAPAVMRPTALVLNVLVGSLTAYRFVSAGLFRWRVLWPFLVGAVPFAFIGGTIQLPGHYYRPIVGVILLIGAAQFLWWSEPKPSHEIQDPPVLLGVLAGAGLGLLSGLTGTGGGIFLSPLILLAGWAPVRTTSGVVAVFILCNSAAGLLGNVASVGSLPPNLPLFAVAVVLGALVGTTLGIRYFAPATILKALGLVLIVAGLKMIGIY
jgi:uncharacterized membrane protein YfcA